MQKEITTAFVLAAGFGKRLKPLTDITPKPLLPIGNTSVLFSIFDKLVDAGINTIIVNTHHLSDAFDTAFEKFRDSSGKIYYRNAQIIKIYEPKILDTGGGIKNAYEYLKESDYFLVHNADIIFTSNIKKFLKVASEKIGHKGTSAVLCLRENGHLNNVGIKDEYVCDIRSTTNIQPHKLMQYTGVFVANKKFLEITHNFESDTFSTVDVFLKSIFENENSIEFVVENGGRWNDIGNHKQYLKECKAYTPTQYTYLARLAEFGFIAKKHTLIQKGASTRTFLRFEEAESNRNLVACFYGTQKREDALYARIAKFLSKENINVPDIVKACGKRRIIVMDDGGSTDLLSIAESNIFKSAFYYGLAIENIRKLHTSATLAFFKKPFELSQPFDDKLYTWEQEYFKQECLTEKYNLSPSQELQNELNYIKSILLSQPLVLLHRDFQSQNIMIDEQKISIIDFQGMRLGCAYYDIASLLFDPYVNLPEELINDLLRLYFRSTPSSEQLRLFYIATCQRLMQALGAYGFLSIKRNKPEYEKYFIPAAKKLAYVAEKLELKNLLSIAKEILNK